MRSGELRVHQSHLVRVVFSPVGEPARGFLGIPRFVRVGPTQKVLPLRRGSLGHLVLPDAHLCTNCEALVVRGKA
jgi:hypothetical protein